MFRPLPLGAVQPRGWMREQLRRDLEHGFASRLDALTPRASHDLFRERIGSSDSFLAWWDAETRGNWLWGYTMMAQLAGLPEHEARVAELIGELLATQDADGYIGIYAGDGRFRHADGENGELWAQSRALLALISRYEATGDDRLFDAVRRAVDLTLRQYPDAVPYFRLGARTARDEITGLTHGLCYLDVLEWLHGRTGEPAYAQAAVRLYLEFSALPRPFPNDDLALPSLQDPQRLFGGHAVHTAEHLRALLWAHELAPDRVPRAAVQEALRRLQLYRVPSGALLGDENVHGFPMPEAAYEFCTSAELAFSLTSAIGHLGHAALGDWLEVLVFNAVQGARLPDGSAIAYLSADTRLAATAARRDSHSPGAPARRFKYSPTHDDVACCCNPNAVRVLPQLVSRMWQALSDEAGFAAVVYGPCELRGRVGDVGVHIVELTAYPFSDGVELEVVPDRPVEFTLLLREPTWSRRTDVTVTGGEATRGGGWVRVRKTWRPGDAVRLAFSCDVRSEEYGNGEAAVLRGPLQYALPVEPRLERTRDYAIAGFHDYDVVPTDVAHAYAAPVLDGAAPELGLRFEAVAGAGGDRPWDAPSCVLRHDRATLVPLGCTILRRAAFPVRRGRGE